MLAKDCLVSSLEVAKELKISVNHCRNVLNGFVQQKCAVKQKVGRIYHFAVIAASKPILTAGRSTVSKRQYKKTGRQKIWNSLKIQRVVSVADLVCLAAVTEANASLYLRKLVNSSYVRVKYAVNTALPNCEVKGRASTYQLLRDTGRLCPIVRKDGCWDQNEQQLYPFNGTNKENHHDQVA
ncbi:hypothetical protein A9Q74_06135 [Colwellia sp. 39_35_sub15_T18]|nr:hypothetical protein A9Q74_06135 [Colwellia sp. 39_35_sub15_T18]